MSDYLQLDHNPEVRHDLLNILLVHLGCRKVALIDYPNNLAVRELIYIFPDIQVTPFDNTFLISLTLVPYPNNPSEVGQLLGYTCYNDDFQDLSVPRATISIVELTTDTHVMTEVCNLNYPVQSQDGKAFLLASEKAVEWTRLMIALGLSYRFRAQIVRDDGTVIRKLRVTDQEYVLDHLEDYLVDLRNFYYPDSIFLRDPMAITNYWELFKFIYSLDHGWKNPDDHRMGVLEEILLASQPQDYSKIVNRSGLLR